jgi:hypothetical protein
MEGEHREFNFIEVKVFEDVDRSLEENDYVRQAEILCEEMSRDIVSDLDLISLTSIVSSIVCNLEEDIEYDESMLPSDDCTVMLFSDDIQDMIYDKVPKKQIFEFIKQELVNRERYELLREIQKNEKNGKILF